MRSPFAVLLFALAGLAVAADPPYDERADAKAAINTALIQARQANVPVLVVFGANWCADCRILDSAFRTGSSAALIGKGFKVVKVDVGRFDRNVDIANRYGVPLKKGIPAVAVLAPDGNVRYSTREGELADARKMGETGIYDFFVKVAAVTIK